MLYQISFKMKSWNSFIFLLNKSLLSTLNAPDPVLSLELQWGDKMGDK